MPTLEGNTADTVNKPKGCTCSYKVKGIGRLKTDPQYTPYPAQIWETPGGVEYIRLFDQESPSRFTVYPKDSIIFISEHQQNEPR